jgi:hypothetical protein
MFRESRERAEKGGARGLNNQSFFNPRKHATARAFGGWGGGYARGEEDCIQAPVSVRRCSPSIALSGRLRLVRREMCEGGGWPYCGWL